MINIFISSLPARRQIAVWLFCLCGFIGLVVLVGGMTRLTDSGLSITEWKPVTGMLPPLSLEAWQQEFAKYQKIPEYRLINRDMDLAAFKSIYWWEWGHRFLARMAGLVFLIPFVYFWATKKINRAELPKFVVLFVLGGAQGALGWYMVKSGLSVRVDVSQYRLAAHLGLAFLVYGYSLWMGLGHWRGQSGGATSPRLLQVGSIALCAMVFLQIMLGALVAGLDAGLTYNSWPLMDGYWIPPGLIRLTPWHLNLFENITLVQFNHRNMAVLVAALTAALWLAGRHVPHLGSALGMVLGMVALQFALGVWTLLAVAPPALAAAHQMGGLISFGAALWLTHLIWRPECAVTDSH